jgi:hypothetical protein
MRASINSRIAFAFLPPRVEALDEPLRENHRYAACHAAGNADRARYSASAGSAVRDRAAA